MALKRTLLNVTGKRINLNKALKVGVVDPFIHVIKWPNIL